MNCILINEFPSVRNTVASRTRRIYRESLEFECRAIRGLNRPPTQELGVDMQRTRSEKRGSRVSSPAKDWVSPVTTRSRLTVTTRFRLELLFQLTSTFFSFSPLLSFHPFSGRGACRRTYIRTVRARRSGSSLMFSRWGRGPFDLLENVYTDEKAKRESKWSPGRKVKARLKSLKDTTRCTLTLLRTRNERIRLLKILTTDVASLIKVCLVTVHGTVGTFQG